MRNDKRNENITDRMGTTDINIIIKTIKGIWQEV
jgi:hypothetical protein